jgi:tetratricopeptide (TPR) repeat protein
MMSISGRFERQVFTLIIAGLLVLAMVVRPSVARLQDEWDCDDSMDYMLEGEASVNAGDHATAAGAYECAIAVDPENYPAYLWRGMLASASGDYDQLGYDLNTFMSHRSANDDTLNITVVKSIATWTKAIDTQPDDAVPYLFRGMAYIVAGIHAQADFQKAVDLAPDNGTGYLFYWLSGNPMAGADFSDEYYVKGAEIVGDSVLLDWVRSFPAEDMTEAIAADNRPYFDAVVESNPDHPFAFAARGMADVLLEDTATATSDFYQHIQNNQAEVVDGDELPLGEEIKLSASAGTVYRLPFQAEAGQTLNFETVRSEGGIFFVFPATQVVLNPAGEVMDAPYNMTVFMGGTRTPINGLEIPESGTYTLVIAPNYSGELKIAAWED